MFLFRRGDHLSFERVYNLPHITKAYLSPAMDLYRNRFADPVIFLYVSDDQEWVRSHMAKDRDLLVASSGALVPEMATGEDLALLSLTDHVITTRGTFSKWAAQLATCGGRYVGLTFMLPNQNCQRSCNASRILILHNFKVWDFCEALYVSSEL